jgi:hypothetical protein
MSTKKMECKFLDHGIALAYQSTVKPCCVWHVDQTFKETHTLEKVNLELWHQHKDITEAKELLANGIWPKNCINCKNVEDQGRQDSIRLGGNNAYRHYTGNDLTLEFRPGSVCNFACQTCWPPASSRVLKFYHQAGLLKKEDKELLTSIDVDHTVSFQNFDFLLPLAHRLKSIILLGGEPFYDKNCISFLQWWQEHTNADLIAFTNGSNLDFEFLTKLKNKLTLVFSLDAIGKPAEYIRFGTDWPLIKSNFDQSRSIKNIDIRVNITTSVYNFYYLPDLIDYLLENWPDVVTFGSAAEVHLTETVIPIPLRLEIKERLIKTVEKLKNSTVEEGQRWNAINAISSIINNLDQTPFDSVQHQTFKDFVTAMDRVKKIRIQDFCPFVFNIIS